MKEWWSYWYNKYGVIVLVAVSGIGAYQAVAWNNIHADVWGIWIGSIGTVGTLIGTIWLATEGERRRLEEQRVRGAIVLPALLGKVLTMKIHSSIVPIRVSAWLDEPTENKTRDRWDALLPIWIEEAQKIPFIPDAQLDAVALISFELAAEIHSTQADIDMGITFLKASLGGDPESWKISADFIKKRFQDCADNLEAAKKEINRLKLLNGWPEIDSLI